jgi:hypothetical protein
VATLIGRESTADLVRFRPSSVGTKTALLNLSVFEDPVAARVSIQAPWDYKEVRECFLVLRLSQAAASALNENVFLRVALISGC